MRRYFFLFCRLINLIYGILCISVVVRKYLNNEGYNLYNINRIGGKVSFVFLDSKRTNGYVFLDKSTIYEVKRLC